MRGAIGKGLATAMLGASAIFISGALLSITTRKPLFSMNISTNGLMISPHADIVTAMCALPAKKDVYFAGCGGL